MGVLEIVEKKELERMILRGRQEERALAEAKIVAEKRAIASNFKKLGLSNEQIAEATGLSLEEVESLK